jgi:hypothetical protein
MQRDTYFMHRDTWESYFNTKGRYWTDRVKFERDNKDFRRNGKRSAGERFSWILQGGESKQRSRQCLLRCGQTASDLLVGFG